MVLENLMWSLKSPLKKWLLFFCISPVIVFLTCLAGGTDNHLVLLDLRPRVSLLVIFEYSTMTSSQAFFTFKIAISRNFQTKFLQYVSTASSRSFSSDLVSRMHARASVEARNEGGTWSFSPRVFFFDGLRRKRDCSQSKIGPNRNCGRTAEVISHLMQSYSLRMSVWQ